MNELDEAKKQAISKLIQHKLTRVLMQLEEGDTTALDELAGIYAEKLTNLSHEELQEEYKKEFGLEVQYVQR